MTFRPDLADCHQAARELHRAAKELSTILKRLSDIERAWRDTKYAALKSEVTQ